MNLIHYISLNLKFNMHVATAFTASHVRSCLLSLQAVIHIFYSF